MRCELREERGARVVELAGEVDLESSPEARRVLLEAVASGGPLFVDLSGVAYIDSSGVASLVEAFQAARSRGTRFGLVAVSPAAMRVLRLARLDRVFEIHADLEEGLLGGG